MSDIKEIFDELNDLEEDFDWDADMNDYDENYNDEVGEAFAKDLSDILNEFIEDSNLYEEFTSENNLNIHFNDHCLGKNPNRKSKYTNVFYDFKDKSQYRQYERELQGKIAKTTYIINSIFDYDTIIKYIRKLFEGDKIIEFSNTCGLKNNKGIVRLVIRAFATDVTKNYLRGNTLDICILDKTGKTITLYPIDTHYLENKLNNILSRYSDYDGNKIIFNR